MSWLDRLGDRLGGLLDEVALPERVRRALDEAERAVASGDARGALDRLRTVEGERSGLFRAAFLEGLAWEALDEPERAAAALERAADRRDVPLVRIALGRVALRLGDARTAREHFEAALEGQARGPDRLEVLLALADLHEQHGRPARAVPVLRHAMRLSADDPMLRLRLARALDDADDLEGALQVIAPLTDAEIPPLDALRLAAALHARVGDGLNRGRAGGLHERVLARAPDDPDSLHGLADVRAAEGRVADALPLYLHALTVAPLDVHAALHAGMARALDAAHELERAMDAWRAAAVLAPTDASVHVAVAAHALDLDLVDEALTASERAITLDPDGRAAAATRGRALLRVGRVDDARAVLAPLRAAEMSADELHALGLLALAEDDAVEAIGLLRESRVRQPGRPGVEDALMRCYARLAPALPDVDDREPASLAPFLDELATAVARHPLLADLVPRTTALRQQLDTPLTVAVLGEFNAGKSTLINAFIGETMVATGVLPTTSHVNVIRYGPRRVARWTHPDGRVEELPYAEAAKLVKTEPERVASLEFLYPHPDLRAIHFLDTPGFNAPDDRHEARATHALQHADAIVWLLDVHQALSSTEFERIRSIDGAAARLLVVVNKVDRLGDDPEALEQVLAHVRGHLGDDHAGLFALSGLRATEARRDPEHPDEAALERWGWTAFESALRDRFFERAGTLKAMEVATGLAAIIDGAVARAEQGADDVGRWRGEVRSRRESLTAATSRWPSTVTAPRRRALDRRLQELRLRAVDETVELATPRPGLFSRPALLDDDRTLLLTRIRDRSRSALQAAFDDVVADAAALDRELLAAIEGTATEVGPPESRTLRRRIEAWLAETATLRALLHERLVRTPAAVRATRLDDEGAARLDRIASGAVRTEAERDAELQRVMPTTSDSWAETLDAWAEEYLAASRRLCDHVERDLELLALDLEHRILRPFRAVRAHLTRPAPHPDAA